MNSSRTSSKVEFLELALYYSIIGIKDPLIGFFILSENDLLHFLAFNKKSDWRGIPLKSIPESILEEEVMEPKYVNIPLEEFSKKLHSYLTSSDWVVRKYAKYLLENI